MTTGTTLRIVIASILTTVVVGGLTVLPMNDYLAGWLQQIDSFGVWGPVQYRREYLSAVPRKILDRDYGCGDPTPYVRQGETVLDLGSGGGKICYIVSDEDVPQHLRDDTAFWSGCISGAFREDRFLQAFENAGFYGIEIAARQSKPWRMVEGIEFRALTVVACKGKQGPCQEQD